jgi:hypothetical protein
MMDSSMEEKEMRSSRRMILSVSTIALMIFASLWPSPGMAQEASAGGQAAPSVSGTGNPGRIAVWKTTTNLGNSQIVQSGGNVGIGTTAPAAKLEVNGDAQVDGNFSLSGSIMLTGAGTLIWATTNNFSAGLGALPTFTTGNFNTAVGDSALNGNTTGYTNTAVGASALYSNTTGAANTASGYEALYTNSTGTGNTAIGYVALKANTPGLTTRPTALTR